MAKKKDMRLEMQDKNSYDIVEPVEEVVEEHSFTIKKDLTLHEQ